MINQNKKAEILFVNLSFHDDHDHCKKMTVCHIIDLGVCVLKINLIGKLSIFLIIALLSGCASQQPPRIVKVPVAVSCPAAKIPPKPRLPIADLTTNSKPQQVVKAYVASIAALQNYNNDLLLLLKAYQQA